MIERTNEREKMIDLQRLFLIECALREKTPEQIDDMVYKMEHIRREVVYTMPQKD